MQVWDRMSAETAIDTTVVFHGTHLEVQPVAAIPSKCIKIGQTFNSKAWNTAQILLNLMPVVNVYSNLFMIPFGLHVVAQHIFRELQILLAKIEH
jgi:hypothetical protein